jgi:hypothetical protein
MKGNKMVGFHKDYTIVIKEPGEKGLIKEAYDHRARELYDHYYLILSENIINNNKPIDSKWIKDKAMELTKDHVNGIHEVGNSPWDPR